MKATPTPKTQRIRHAVSVPLRIIQHKDSHLAAAGASLGRPACLRRRCGRRRCGLWRLGRWHRCCRPDVHPRAPSQDGQRTGHALARRRRGSDPACSLFREGREEQVARRPPRVARSGRPPSWGWLAAAPGPRKLGGSALQGPPAAPPRRLPQPPARPPQLGLGGLVVSARPGAR